MGTKITSDERMLIAKWTRLGHSIRSVAATLGRAPSTVSAELKRNVAAYAAPGEFWVRARSADVLFRTRRSQASKRMRLKCQEIRHYVELHLRLARWTPEAIAGNLKRLGFQICAESIYLWINQERPDLKSSLWVAGKERRRRCTGRKRRVQPVAAASKRSIETLPIESRERTEIGHFELDAMLGKRGTGAIQNKTDRYSRKMFLDKANSLEAAPYADLLIERLRRDIPAGILKTILQDNGTEHAEHARVDAALNIFNFFCHPYCASEHGTVENRNGVLRRFLPKGSDLSSLPQEYLEWIEDYFNNMPMKILGFLTPNQVWEAELKKAA